MENKEMNKKKIILFTNARDENNILEWVVHHKNLGFDHIFITDHRSKTPLSKILSKVPNLTIQRRDGDIAKCQLVFQAFEHSQANRYDWMLYLDADEFLVLNKHENVHDFLQGFSSYDQVGMNWLCFGSNYLEDVLTDQQTILESYSRSEKHLDRHLKTFFNVNTRNLVTLGGRSPHVIEFSDLSNSVTSDVELLNIDDPWWFPNPKSYLEVSAFVAHYIYQSYSTYLNRKINLPTDNSPTEFRPLLTKKVFHSSYNDEQNLHVMNKYNAKNKLVIQSLKSSTLGFVLTRHVTSETTNLYWKECISQIRLFYPSNLIMVVDDNSVLEYLNQDGVCLDNCMIIKGEFPGCGEMLAYYYFHKYRLFEKAIVIHDSVFIQTKLEVESVDDVEFLWHFNSYPDIFKCNYQPYKKQLGLDTEKFLDVWDKQEWYGCFGVMSIITYIFLDSLVTKYNLFSLILETKNREDRMAQERIFGFLGTFELGLKNKKIQSRFGQIHQYIQNDYSWASYQLHKSTNSLNGYQIIKVWSGR